MPALLIAGLVLLLVLHPHAQTPALAPAAQAGATQLGQISQPAAPAPPASSSGPGVGAQLGALGANAAGSLVTAGASAAAGVGGTTVGLGAALGTAAETAGIGAAAYFAVEGITNLFECGTIGKVGCNKRSDAANQDKAYTAMRQTAYAAEIGQITPTAAIAQINGIKAALEQVYIDPANKAGVKPFTQYQCGQSVGIPQDSQSAMFHCLMPGETLNDFVSGLNALVATFGQPQPASALASVPGEPLTHVYGAVSQPANIRNPDLLQ